MATELVPRWRRSRLGQAGLIKQLVLRTYSAATAIKNPQEQPVTVLSTEPSFVTLRYPATPAKNTKATETVVAKATATGFVISFRKCIQPGKKSSGSTWCSRLETSDPPMIFPKICRPPTLLAECRTFRTSPSLGSRYSKPIRISPVFCESSAVARLLSAVASRMPQSRISPSAVGTILSSLDEGKSVSRTASLPEFQRSKVVTVRHLTSVPL